ncbi:mechanosensitive ion channel protein MscS [Oceanidesulfovibrio indonesiensis]|uniref:Mechanosensitive ion channel protein MscS n=1 Tax=Oceanidesulfovibrio indonesiensis TaxID=54767 RepID=A0A7M3MI04_9BACT|nr:mechanosensitive ion channel family protein [Oceanidesulfovibrio indonesiensis]TVM19318.1 mechanosensitive ion channel protein MscS [Oceanidesulfovibrio indonesiensis]
MRLHATTPLPCSSGLVLALAVVLLLTLCIGATAAQTPSEPQSPDDTPAQVTDDPADPNAVPSAPAEPSAEDEALRARLERILAGMDGVDTVAVRVQDGVVWLSAEAEDAATRETALEVARKLDGVVHVVDEVTLNTAAATRISFLWRTLNELWSNTLAVIPALVIALVVLLLFVLLAVGLARSRGVGRRFTRNPLLASSLHRILGLAVFALGLLAALEVLGLTAVAGAVLGAAGLFGLTVGFAFRDIMENYLAGILLSLRSPFTVDDFVDVGGHAGSVVRMNSRELVLMTLDGNHLRLPNAFVFESVIINFTRNPLRGFSFTVGIGGDEDLSEVQRIGCRALALLPGVMGNPGPFMRVESLSDFAVIVRFHGWVDQRAHEFLKVQSEAIRIVKEALDAAGVAMPAPRQDIHLLREDVATEEKHEMPKRPEDIAASARRADVSRETFLDEQIQEDRAEAAREGESNVLDKRHEKAKPATE